jgi:hypothetical protein
MLAKPTLSPITTTFEMGILANEKLYASQFNQYENANY